MIAVKTEYPIALTSPDHIHPYGTKRDNTVNQKFNAKLLKVIKTRPVSVLDLGCAGGGFVKSMLDAGHFAVGIEGSDYCKRNRSKEWGTIPENLFTADARKPFTVCDESENIIRFDAVTAFEFFEHIDLPGLSGVIDNVKRHLKPGGLLIGSINTHSSQLNGIDYHLTVEKPIWWIEMFEMHGFIYRKDLWHVIDPDWLRLCTGAFQVVFEMDVTYG